MVKAVVAFNDLSGDFGVNRSGSSATKIVIGRFRTPLPLHPEAT
jgi:hypothetical protein